MVKTTLVGPDVALGQEALRVLDAAKFPVTAAMWLLQRERSDWKFVIATPLYDRLGAQEAYFRLYKILGSGEAVSDLPIRLESNRRPLIKALRKTFGRATSVDGMRLGLQSIGGVWVERRLRLSDRILGQFLCTLNARPASTIWRPARRVPVSD